MDLKSAIKQLGGDYDSLMKEYRRVSSILGKFGLSEYESRAYIALVALGPSSGNFVAEVAQIPRTSAYKTMKGLEARGYVQAQKGRPRVFAPTNPEELAKRHVAELEEAFGKISALKDLLSERGVPQLVYTIMGRERVLDKIGEMLDRSRYSFVISSPSMTMFRGALGKQFSGAISRGLPVTVITSPFVKVPRGAKVIRRKALIATDVISDGKTALIAAPDLSACGYTDNETLSRHLEDFLRIMGESRE